MLQQGAKGGAVLALISLMWGVNPCFSHSRERLPWDSKLTALWSGGKENRATGRGRNEGIPRKCSGLLWSSGERGKPQPKKALEEGGGSCVKPHPSHESISY